MARALASLQPARKTERIALSNAVTRVRRAVPVDAALSPQVRDGLVAEAAEALAKAPSRVWNANVNGVIVQLRTNVRHLHEFWADNWAPAPLEADLEPHGVVYAVDGLPGREPRSFYDSATKTGVLVNVDAYGPLRSLALGLVTDVSERLFGVHALRGMAVEAGGAGLILVGPPGTNKTELFLGLLRDPKVRFHASEIVFLRAAGERVWADNPERKAFLPTSAVEILPRLAPLFDAALCENVVLRKEDCRDAACLRGEDCRLDRGSAFCYKAAPDAYGLLDPAWLAGPEGAVRRAELRRIFLLRKDAVSPPVEEIGRDAALRILVAGEVPGMKTGLTAPAKPFFNPHLLVTGEERQELRKAFFARILGGLNTYVLNAGAAGPEKIREIAGI